MGTNHDPNGIKRSLVETLRDLFGRDGNASQGAALARFETTVEALLQSHGSAVLGRLHYLNLEELIIRRGPGRKTRLKKAENLILSVIGKNLKEGETYVRPEVSVIWFLFPNLTREAGDLKCAAIADQIARALTEDDPVFSDLKSEKTVQQIDQRTWGASRATRRPVAGLSGDAKGTKSPVTPAPAKTGSPEHPRAQKSGGAFQRDVPPSPPAAYATDRRFEGIRVAYQAIWNVRSKMIMFHAAVPRRHHPDGTIKRGKRILGADASFALSAALDSFVLRKAAAWLHGLMNVRQQTLLVLPVHFTTVDSQTLFQPYRQELAALTPDERKYIVLEILGASDTLPTIRIKDIISRLRPFARGAFVQLPPDSTHIRHWAEGGFIGVGFSTGEENLSEKFLMAKMDTFVASAEEAGVHSYVRDLATTSLAMAAVAAGFRYVGGEAILPESEVPNPIEPFECERIFSRVVSK